MKDRVLDIMLQNRDKLHVSINNTGDKWQMFNVALNINVSQEVLEILVNDPVERSEENVQQQQD